MTTDILSMTQTARREIVITLTAAIVWTGLLYPALMYARREARDGIRRNEIAAFKQLLEQYYNEHEIYPREFDARPHDYVVVTSSAEGATAWYLRARLENGHESVAAHDHDEGRQYDYRYIREGNATFYEVCGGTPTCDLDDPR